MIAIVKCYKHETLLQDQYVIFQVIKTFFECDEQTQKEAIELATTLSKENGYEYKVLIDLSCVAVVQNKSNT